MYKLLYAVMFNEGQHEPQAIQIISSDVGS